MQKTTTLLIVFTMAAALSSLGCAGKCPAVKAGMSPASLAYDDALRVNALVERRNGLMESAKGGDFSSFELERLKFSVTAYELAIKMQLRIVELAKGSELYDANIEEINAARCMFDDICEGELKDPADATMSDRGGKDVQEKSALFKKLFNKEGAVSKYELKEYMEKGVKVPKKPPEYDEEVGGKKKKAEEDDEEGDGEEAEEEEDEEDEEEDEEEEEEEEEEEDEETDDTDDFF